ncbi:MAG: hypothetical protein ACYDAE_00475 [Steroidobacteraceae bacterium]
MKKTAKIDKIISELTSGQQAHDPEPDDIGVNCAPTFRRVQ